MKVEDAVLQMTERGSSHPDEDVHIERGSSHPNDEDDERKGDSHHRRDKQNHGSTDR